VGLGWGVHWSECNLIITSTHTKQIVFHTSPSLPRYKTFGLFSVHINKLQQHLGTSTPLCHPHIPCTIQHFSRELMKVVVQRSHKPLDFILFSGLHVVWCVVWRGVWVCGWCGVWCGVVCGVVWCVGCVVCGGCGVCWVMWWVCGVW
jgi:hypothetical protein